MVTEADHHRLDDDGACRPKPRLEDIPYADFVEMLAKPGKDIITQMTPLKADLLHMGLGVTGEAGELADAIKRYAIYGKEMDRTNIVEELGDLLWYETHIKTLLAISDDEIIAANKKKLSQRYAGLVYSDYDAQTRADKSEQVVPSAANPNVAMGFEHLKIKATGTVK